MDADCELIWKNDAGHRQFECGKVVDHSATGVAVVSPQPLPASSSVIIRVPSLGMVALSQVRSCSWGRTQYRLGIKFLDKASARPDAAGTEPDYHEVLRAGASGEFERVEKLYRSLAFRYHPDNRDTGDSEIFLRMKEAFRILSSSQPQVAESGIARSFNAFRGPEVFHAQRERRRAVLGLLYQKRVDDYRNAAMSTNDIETVTGLHPDEVGFVLWYLQEKGAVSVSGYNADYTISAAGVDSFEAVRIAE